MFEINGENLCISKERLSELVAKTYADFRLPKDEKDESVIKNMLNEINQLKFAKEESDNIINQ